MSDSLTIESREETPSLNFLAGGGEMGSLLRAYDWAATALGAPEDWPQSLKTAVRIMLTSRQPIWIGWGPELIYLYNDAYQSIIGGKHPWALGRPAREVWSEIWPDIGPLLATAMGGLEGTYVEEQLLIMERNGYPEETYYTFSYSPIPDDAGEPGGIICANTEDTARVIGERQLLLLRELAAMTVDARSWRDACERSVQALARNTHDAPFALIYLWSEAEQRLVLAGSAGLAASHPAAPEALDRSDPSPWPAGALLDAADPVLLDDLGRRFAEPLPSGPWSQPITRAALLPLPSADTGRAGVLIVGLNPFRLFDEGYRGFLGLAAGQIASAIASADAYEEERRRVEALAELDRAKTAFFSNVSHEFRTPLTLMLGPLEETLLDPSLPAHVREQIGLAHRNGARLLRLVNSLLDFSRIEAGRMRAAFRPIDLCHFSAEIASSFRSAVEKAGLELDIKAKVLPQPVYVDPDLWEKVLLNLLSNAFKFTHEGGIAVEIEAAADGRAAVVRVRDTGIGISAAELPKLFDRFHRVEGAQGRSFEGSGIGLALVYELVKLHGGEIHVESTPGVGTVFTIELPFGKAHLAAELVRDEPALAGGQATGFLEEALRWTPDHAEILPDGGPAPAARADAAQVGGRGKRVLLADDNADMRDYVARLLEAQGYVVDTAADGEAALERIKAATPDLILTDVMMPKLDGFGLLRAVRGAPETAGAPVIMLSARAGEEAKVDGLDAGADDYLVKPFAARELLARVNANIQMAEVRRAANRAVFLSEQRYLMTQERLSRALSMGRVSLYDWQVDEDRLRLQGPLAELFGVPAEEALRGLPLDAFFEGIHPDDREATRAAVQRALETRQPFEVEYRTHGAGEIRTVLSRGEILTGSEGETVFAGALIDLTREKAAERALEEQAQALGVLNRAAAAVSGNLDLEQLVQIVTDAAVELTGAEFGAFFYNVVNASGESYMLYTLSGASPAAFEKMPMPRNTAVFGPTFAGEGVVRSADITRDPRYGLSAPHHGMPPGHLPVCSYLAAPVRSRSGEVLGGLFFGHSRPGVFGQLAEDRVKALASQAAVAIDNVRLFQAAQEEIAQRRKAEETLQALNASLEERVASEIAQRLQAEDALRQAQKMEAIGQLTGGVAHDFNNLLTVIMGGLDTIRRSRPEDAARRERAMDMALKGAQRAANLTSRLLAFSRRQPLEPRPLDLNLIVRDMTDLLHRTLGEQIELEGVLAPRLWAIEADQNQLESAILNLAVNARDAMPEGGKLTLETANTMLDESYVAADREVVPGQYVAISVSDTGSGMSKDTLARVFEPFFTTKEVGKGTGLGLSMVYGFVKQSGGHVTVYSEVGEGTTVKLYFPRFRGGAAADDAPAVATMPRASEGEVVLLVEDNEDVREYSAMILSELGYGVVQAADADAAVAILETAQPITLLFTDVVLPGKSGRVLADAAARLRPGLKVLFTTGYSRNAIVHHGRLDPGVELISKPFTFEQLAVRVRDVLDKR